MAIGHSHITKSQLQLLVIRIDCMGLLKIRVSMFGILWKRQKHTTKNPFKHATQWEGAFNNQNEQDFDPHFFHMPSEGAFCYILKRLDDAEHDNDKIYGILRGVHISSAGPGEGHVGLTAGNRGGTKNSN
eukprot:Phypoly_transcript_05089.p1 GENE.Phypoly_transcript_05089~~Phypoly_transcript_05089.p1  ORF type:complete len:130 (+),score=11.41 Phypoly_transcript_05089:149-538(+)